VAVRHEHRSEKADNPVPTVVVVVGILAVVVVVVVMEPIPVRVSLGVPAWLAAVGTVLVVVMVGLLHVTTVALRAAPRSLRPHRVYEPMASKDARQESPPQEQHA
jgi:protein-S-isoprenylcysteine O-methyltransferase Ste14